ncbi:glycosyltransferase family 9 protein [Paraburkholderia sp.]|uniref:glycosyltransferase family 9 protein n=1 Tax=Paraburkholderia sp. TaxID=1926495 RepID=UPI0039E507A3
MLHHLVFLRAKMCEWPVYAPPPGVDSELMRRSNPENADAHIWLGRQYLKKGDFDKGASEIGWMWHQRAPELVDQKGLFIDEAGRPIRQDGRTVVLSADSGLGDTLQFVRYARALKELGARVVVECQSEFVRLIRNTAEIDEVVAVGQLSDGEDLRVPLHNLMSAFRSTTPDSIPNAVPYVRPHDEETDSWRQRVAPLPGLRVGLCWSGNLRHQRNRSRSIPVGQMSSLFELPGVSWISLQKDSDVAVPALLDWSAEFVDLAATAALVQNLDLVITVDSAVAHLAGALGRPVWLLNRLDSCWRWMEGRTDSPWYPTLTQFRQRRAGDWSDVLPEVAASLTTLTGERKKSAARPRRRSRAAVPAVA